MTPTPPSTNSSNGGHSPEEQFRVVRKRNRVPLSCYPCRTRKLKCNRQHPCSNCTKREGMGTSSCTYAAPPSHKKSQNTADLSPDDMQNRIDRLEGLVLSLMHNGGTVDPATTDAAGRSHSMSQSVTDSSISLKMDQEDEAPVPEEESDVEDGLVASLGFLKVDAANGKSMYIGQEHWHTILSDISEVKNYFASHKQELENGYERVKLSKPIAAREGPTLLLGAQQASEIELRTALPSKSHVLTLCSRYFNSMDNAVSILHGPTFLQQLRAHWQDPEKTPVIWLGLLYSVLTLAMLSYQKVGDEPADWKGRALDLAAEYRLRTVQCLIKADYTKPVEYTVETMMLYILGEYASRWDADLGLWLVTSMITRIAIRMGYHRDAQWFPSLTPFQAEMRRRTWALIRMSDVVFSHQVSLPSMIDENDCDTQLPNNYLDDDFHPTIKVLPTPRPSSEPTPIAYMIAKAKLCFELGTILKSANKVGKTVTYDEIIRLDAKLCQVMQELPPHLKLTGLEASHDPVTLTIARYNIDTLYQKILCLLHRAYLKRARQSPRYAHSRRRAIEASMRAMEHLSTLYRESQPTGKLRTVSWYIKSTATKEFVLPAMLIILDLHYDNIAIQTNASQEAEGAFVWDESQRSRMIGTLEQALKIWGSLADSSMEAFKASKVLEIMLEKIRSPLQSSRTSPENSNNFTPRTDLGLQMDQNPTISQDFLSTSSNARLSPEENLFAANNTGLFAGMDFSLPPVGMADFPMDGLNGAGAMSPLSMFANMGGGTDNVADLTSNFDWSTFESYTQLSNFGTDPGFQLYTDAKTEQLPSANGSPGSGDGLVNGGNLPL